MPQANLRAPVDRDAPPTAAGPPDGVVAQLRAAAGRLRAVDLFFWGLLVLALALLVAPMWVGPMPPLTDFGGHVQIADAWVRVPTDPFIAGLVERHDSWLVPNLLAARFAATLHPLLDVVSGLRLFVTLCMVGLVGGILWVLREWGRTRWLVFLALPFTWNGMLALGLINYAAAMVLMFVVVALGHRYGRHGRTRDAIALAAALVLAFWAHGLGAPITLLMALFVLVVSAARPRRLLGLLALVPSVVLWLQWYLRMRRALGVGNEPETSFSMQKSWDELLINTIDVHVDGGDMAVLAVLVGAWIVLLATSRRGADELGDAPTLASWRAAPVASARAFGARVWREASDNALLLLAVGLLFGYFFVAPAYIGSTFISPRLIVPAVLLLFMVPRVPERGLLPKLAIGAAVLASFVFARDVGRHVAAFEHEELEPVALLAEEIPRDSRVLCAEVFRVDPVFIRAPLDHNCNGVLVARSGGFADGAFADTPYNGVMLRDAGDKVRLRPNKWQSFQALSRLDYLVVRGDHRAPAPDVAEVVDTIEPELWELGPSWTLYRVVHPDRVETTYEDACGGTGGAPLLWNCPKGMAVSGIIATTTPDGKLLGSVQARCRALEVRSDGVVEYTGRRETGPRFGEAVQHHRRVVECPGGQVLVGLSGTSSSYVNQVGILCGEGRLVATEAAASVEVLKFAETGEERGMVGGDAGAPFALVCPEDSVPIGIRGGFGYMIDAFGIACAEARQVLAAAAALEEEAPAPPQGRTREPSERVEPPRDRSPSGAREKARKAPKTDAKRPTAGERASKKAATPTVGPPVPVGP
ncbi:MAG: hypothetical protein EP329_06870, partial [Deltaproteobacteria bacterium]